MRNNYCRTLLPVRNRTITDEAESKGVAYIILHSLGMVVSHSTWEISLNFEEIIFTEPSAMKSSLFSIVGFFVKIVWPAISIDTLNMLYKIQPILATSLVS